MSDTTGPRLAGLLHHLRHNAARYYPEFGSGELHVRCRVCREGALSSVYEFEMRTAGSERAVVVKLPPADAHRDPATSRRPRVAPLLDPHTKVESEEAALRAIQRHFDALGDPRFGSVRMLDSLPAQRALVMEKTRGRTLRDLLARANRLSRPLGSRPLASILSNAGAWLRAYHGLPALAHTRTRNGTRGDFAASVRSLAGFLASARPAGEFLVTAAARAEACAEARLPAALPLGMGHGDLAPRNVIVDGDGRVTVLDTRAAWRAPIYEDIAYFLTALKTPRAQSASLGLAFGRSALARLEGAFLRGYFGGEPVPIDCIRLFELQALLDKWASDTERRQLDRPARRIGAGYGDWSMDRLFQRSVAAVVAELPPAEVAA